MLQSLLIQAFKNDKDRLHKTSETGGGQAIDHIVYRMASPTLVTIPFLQVTHTLLRSQSSQP